MAFSLLLHGRHLKRLTESRDPISREEFLERMVANGIGREASVAVYDFAKFYYPDGLTPYPDDRWTGTLRIHPEDLEDFAAEWWEQNGWLKPSPADPVVIPADPSLFELARWLESTKAVQRHG